MNIAAEAFWKEIADSIEQVFVKNTAFAHGLLPNSVQ